MMHMAIRHADGSVEAWRDLHYLPPLQVVVGMEILAQARFWRAGVPVPLDPTLSEPIVVKVYSGPGAHLPTPPTACEFNRAMEDEWLLREWELTI